MSIIDKCPYCESKNIEFLGTAYGRNECYHCKDCDWLFDEDDVKRELLRHQISPILDDTNEESPKEIFFTIPSAEEEAHGLSSLEIPAIDKIFEVHGEGTIWYHIDGEVEMPGFKNIWHDLDELSTSDLEALLDYLKNN